MNFVRALDQNGDWIFGVSGSAYLTGKAALAQQIKCGVLTFLGECFFAANFGVDWFNLLGFKNQSLLDLAVRTQILNTGGGGQVTGIKTLSLKYDAATRKLTISYVVQTIYSQLSNTFQYALGGQNA